MTGASAKGFNPIPSDNKQVSAKHQNRYEEDERNRPFGQEPLATQ
jgi:hypothetical protein